MNQTLASITRRADPLITGALLTLALQDLLLLLALFSATQPHPPHAVGPFIGALLAASLRVAWGMRRPSRWTLGLALLAALAHLPNFGPHKLFLAQADQIWPMVLLGLVLIAQVALLAALRLRGSGLKPDQVEAVVDVAADHQRLARKFVDTPAA